MEKNLVTEVIIYTRKLVEQKRDPRKAVAIWAGKGEGRPHTEKDVGCTATRKETEKETDDQMRSYMHSKETGIRNY